MNKDNDRPAGMNEAGHIVLGQGLTPPAPKVSISDSDPDSIMNMVGIRTKRCRDRMDRIRKVMIDYGMAPPPTNLHFRFVSEREQYLFIDMLFKRYEKKYSKSNLLQDIVDLGVKDRTIFKIVSVDKEWLFFDLIKKRTLRAQDEGDLVFLKKLGEAIAKEPKIRPLRSPQPAGDPENYQRVLDFSEAYIDSQRVESPDNKLRRGVLHKLHEVLRKKHETWFPETLLNDKQYFTKFLRRNGIILPASKKSSSKLSQEK